MDEGGVTEVMNVVDTASGICAQDNLGKIIENTRRTEEKR